VGLAARSGSDGPTDIERLTDELRQFISRIEDDPAPFEADRADESTDIADTIDFAIDRDDEVGRLSEVIEDLTVAVRERERRRAESDRATDGTSTGSRPTPNSGRGEDPTTARARL